MTELIKVRTVEGRLLPFEPPKLGYVGYRVVTADEDANHVIPVNVLKDGRPARGQLRYQRDEGVIEVPNTTYYRRAITVGDLARDEELAAVQNALREPSSSEPTEPSEGV